MAEVVLEWIAADDPRMAEVDDLRHVTLFEPFGVPRADSWNDGVGGALHLTAFRGGRAVGYACLIVDERCGTVRQVCVASELHGTGVGRALMTEVVEQARRLALDSLVLNARVTAEDFYLRLGWATTSGRFPFGRTGMQHVRMEFPLHPSGL
ncbi:MAG: GNAT family N-acetyltransferase [Coriobacteriia bacterium]|nr:GNAT family N-acetyltransferase [Coriobacteriia bacterium]MBN2822998.1 GNAT family N-acetyltransferase [Coriobacteriia bacterium]